MIQLTAHMRILVAVEPQDFRRGIDVLAAVCRKQLDADPSYRRIASPPQAVTWRLAKLKFA
jgi:hypothetical protein